MKNHKKLIAIILCAVMACFVAFPSSSSGLEIIDQGLSEIEMPSNSQDTAQAITFAFPPDHLYPFVYNNGQPYVWLEMDTSDCVNGRLYVYDINTDEITLICEAAITSYATTKNYLIYAHDNKLILTDYMGTEHKTIFQSVTGALSSVYAFGQLVCFVESNETLMLLDTSTLQTQVVHSMDGLQYAYMRDFDEIILGDNFNMHYVLNTDTSALSQSMTEEELDSYLSAQVQLLSNAHSDAQIQSTYTSSNAIYSPMNSTKHFVSLDCCTGSYLSAHTLNANGACTLCGYNSDFIGINTISNEMVSFEDGEMF